MDEKPVSHIASPGADTLCGLRPSDDVVAYDLCSLGTRGGWCKECCHELYLSWVSDEEENELFCLGLNAIATDVVLSLTGGSDSMDPDDFWMRVLYLEYRIHTWNPTPLDVLREYDDAMSARVVAALELVYGGAAAMGWYVPPDPEWVWVCNPRDGGGRKEYRVVSQSSNRRVVIEP